MNQKPPSGRRSYLDVMRGLAVLIMIEAHVLDSWTRAADRSNPWFGISLIVGGLGAPLFLFLAGVAISLSAGTKARRLGDERFAVKAVQIRGLEIYLLAFLFRLQAVVLSRSSAWSMLKVDILNLMGPSIIATAWIWGALRSARGRFAAFVTATAVLAFTTPIVRSLPALAALPDFIEGYIRPVPGVTNFAIFPWAAFVPAGAAVGVLIENAPVGVEETRLNVKLALAGITLALLAYACSFLPSPYARSSFWTSSPAFFFLRVGVMTAIVALTYFWEQRPVAQRRWSPLQTLGRSSLFVYWVHVELVYGLVSMPLHGALSFAQAWIALVAFWVFMLGLTVAKDRTARWWKRGVRAGGRRWPLLTSR